MTTQALLEALARLRVETGSLACLGCGHEHNCSVHGCAILREAAALVEDQMTTIRGLRFRLTGYHMEDSFNRGLLIAESQRRRKAEAERDALREKMPQWISVEDRLPEPETDVLIVCNRNDYIFVVPAIYEDGKMLTQNSAWNWSDIYGYGLYSEEDDDYFIPNGWWENRQFNPDDVYNNPIDCAVTHWMPLPEAPEEGGRRPSGADGF